jgi:hypothetical protein
LIFFVLFVSVSRFEGKRPLGRPRLREENNIGMYLREIWWEGVDWIPSDSIKGIESVE